MDKQENKRKLLVVDDEPIVRESLQDWLGSYGFDVSTAENGEQALEIIHNQDFGVVILDLRLPDMEGNEVLMKARKFRPDLKAIIITAYPSKETTIEAVRLGVAEYLVKPFEPEELVDLVNEVLDGVKPGTNNDFTMRGSLSALVSEWKMQKGDTPHSD